MTSRDNGVSALGAARRDPTALRPLSHRHTAIQSAWQAWTSPRFVIRQAVAVVVSSCLLLFVVVIGLVTRLQGYRERRQRRPYVRQPAWDCPERWQNERLVKCPQYYARNCGFDIVDETVETEDGYFLRMHRVRCLNPNPALMALGGGYPILIMHGLFQSSGSFITSEERSIAFWFAARGYSVYLGNNRAVFDMGHRTFSRHSPAFWDYDVGDLAMYDLPAMVDYVRAQTGFDKVAYIGHSQGNAIAFIALSQWYRPELGDKLSYFGALAPAVFIGPLKDRFPLQGLRSLDWDAWSRMFGELDFTPLMKFSYDWTPARPYAALGYQMFAYLFDWNDTHWLKRRKPKMFRFTPEAVSSRQLFWWAGKNGFAARGCLFDPDTQWYNEKFPPLALYGGGEDHLVLPKPASQHFHAHEPHVYILREQIQPTAEHCDHYWAADAVEWCFHDILGTLSFSRPDDIERTRTDKTVLPNT